MSLQPVPTTNSKAQTGLGTVLSIGPAASLTGEATYVAIEEVMNADESGLERAVTKYGLLNNQYTQKRAGQIDAGQFTVKVARVATAPGQVALKAAATDPTGQPYLFQVALYANTENGQAATGDTAVFPAIISKYNEFGSISPESVIQTEFTLDLTGPITVTAGS